MAAGAGNVPQLQAIITSHTVCSMHVQDDVLLIAALFKLFCYGTLIHSEFGCGTHTLWNRKPTFHKPCNESYLFKTLYKFTYQI